MRISQKKKNEIFARDKFECQYCGDHTDQPVCDHAYPILKGGDNEDYNLLTACPGCAAQKGTLDIEEYNKDYTINTNILNTLSKRRQESSLNTLCKKLNKKGRTLKEKDKEKEEEKDKDGKGSKGKGFPESAHSLDIRKKAILEELKPLNDYLERNSGKAHTNEWDSKFKRQKKLKDELKAINEEIKFRKR